MPKRAREADPRWDDVIVTERPDKENPLCECKYCHHTWYSNSLSRLLKHMQERCSKLPEDLYAAYNRVPIAPKRQLLQSRLSYSEHALPEAQRQQLDQLLAEAVYSSGIPLNFVSKPHTNTIAIADKLPG